MRFPVELLVVTCLVVGIIPGITIGPFLHMAVVAVLGLDTPSYSLAVWHGFTLPLLMSVIALVGGVTLYAILRTYLPGGATLPLLRRWKGKRIVGRTADASARWLVNLLGTRRLQPQLRLLVAAAFLAALWPLYGRGLALMPLDPSRIDVAFALVWGVGIICALGTAYQAKYHRLAALILMGGAGLVVCITFAWLSAPDLALTQLLVEIVTTVLILLGLRWLPKRLEEATPSTGAMAAWLRRLRDLIIALAAGAGLSAIAYAMMIRPPPDGIFRGARAHGGRWRQCRQRHPRRLSRL
jgi:multicomponent K+:H+ antiporter subunit A